jgi:assimilatory nitrate reductase catalytic subunit
MKTVKPRSPVADHASRITRHASFLRDWNGPLTQDLVLHPAACGLGRLPARLQPEATTTTVCGFCSTGCGLDVHLRDGQAINLSATQDYPVNLGMACPKGWEALTPLRAPDRAETPLLRDRGGRLQPVDWDLAMQIFTLRFRAILDQHGPESVAWLGTGQICTEELALLGALCKFGMGIIHGDGNTRQCMATSVAAYKESFGFDAPPYTYADFEQSDVIILIGSNLCITHPILWQRVLRNQNKPQIIVLDPRKTETAMAAGQHLALNPGSDLVLLYGLAHLLIAKHWTNCEFIARHTTGFDQFSDFVRAFAPKVVAAQTGLTVEQICALAQAIHRGKAVSFWWTMGVNQGHQATRTAQAIINLALMTGNIGKAGSGANSITGQCNAMGSRLFSNTTNLLGGRDFLNPEDRRKVAHVLGLSPEKIPSRNSLAYDQIIDGIDQGRIKGLWIIATNTAHSWINQSAFHHLRAKLDFLVVQDMYHSTDTAQMADLVLPAAGWGEKEGTFINSERRIGLVKRVARAPGQALSDFNIFKLVAHYWGCAGLFREWTSPESVFHILKHLSAGQPCDFTGIANYQHLEECGGIQWPYPEEWRVTSDAWRGHRGTPSPLAPRPSSRLFEDGRFFTADARARFVFEQPCSLPETPDKEFPFLLLTGRGTSAQWHTGTRTEKSDVLRKLRPGGIYVEINDQDAGRLGIRAETSVRISSRRGSIIAKTFITATIRPGQVFLPMHYLQTNRLTIPIFDPYSRQPAYKACAVRLDRLDSARHK